MRSALVAAGALVAGVLIWWLPQGAAGSSIGGCAPTRAAMKHVLGSNGAGQTVYRLTVTNRGRGSCEFQNQPRLTLLGTGGKALPTHVSWSGKLRNVTFGPGRSVSSLLRFSPDVPARGEPQKGHRCEPVAHQIRIVLALHLKTLGRAVSVTGPVRPPTSVCEHGGMKASSLH